MTTTSTPPAPPTEPPGRRSYSGRAFVVTCALAVVAFVAFLVFVSPVLLERTLEAAPPPAPQEVAAGEAGGQAWTASAVEQGPDVPCLELRAASAVSTLCTEPRGGSLRGTVTAEAGGATVLGGIVDARTAQVRLAFAGGGAVAVEPAYVDFGFPLGFFAAELPAGADLTHVEALDREGELRGAASCTTSADGPACSVTDRG